MPEPSASCTYLSRLIANASEAGDVDSLRALEGSLRSASDLTAAEHDDVREQFSALAQFGCTLPGADQVAYFTFKNQQAVMGAYTFTPRAITGGPCGQKWNVQSSYHLETPEPIGYLKCYTDKGIAWLEWTRTDHLIYAYASRKDGDRQALFHAWLGAGPVHN